MSFFGKIHFFFKHHSAMALAIRAVEEARSDALRKAKSTNLQLCFDHQQESNGSHYSEHNCDHCKALRKIDVLNDILETRGER
jgi:hypothetical protein